ncbi:MAG: hypothetical protein KAS32_00545, partial [Candidatus Peribacteraceae bacterium]|nr:hypothetical protein [Candidatus Peribacteraceae bacterium]
MRYLFEDLIIMEKEGNELPPKEKQEAEALPPQPKPQIDPVVTGAVPEDPSAEFDMGLEEPKTPEEVMKDLGKVYVMKKTYAKLLAISNILDNYSDEKFDDVRVKVLETLDIFTVIVNNYDQFQDDVDKIIDVFIKFTVKATEELDRLT